MFWNKKAVPKDAEGFDRAVRSGRCAPHVYIGVGGLEQDPAAYQALTPLTPAEVARIIDSTRMIDNARALVDQLRAVRGPADHQTTLEVFPGASHLSEVPVAISHGFGFALRPDPPPR